MAGRDLSIILRARDDASRTLDKFTRATGSKFGKLGGAALKLGLAFGGLMVIGRVGGFLKECTLAAEADARAQAVLNQVARNNTGATAAQLEVLEKYILQTSIATGVTDDLIRTALSPLVATTKDLSEAQDILSVAMDVAVGRNLDLNSIAVALSKAHNGQVTALQRLGIQTKDASGKTLTFAQMLDQLRGAYAGATQAAAQNNVWQRLSIIWSEMKESIGAALLPQLKRLGEWVAKNPEAIAAGLSRIAGAFANIVSWVSATLSAVQGFFAWLAGNTQAGGGGNSTPAYNKASMAASGAAWLEANPNAPKAQRDKVQGYVDQYKYTPITGSPTSTIQTPGGGSSGKGGGQRGTSSVGSNNQTIVLQVDGREITRAVARSAVHTGRGGVS